MAEGEVYELIGLVEVEGLLVGAEDLPFKGVFGLQHVELAGEGGGVGGFGEVGGADGCADENGGALGAFAECRGREAA